MEKTPQDLELICKYFTEFTAQQLQQLAALKEVYTDWNSKINVISRKDIDGLYEKHVLHSLSIAAVTAFAPGTSIIDIGTGGGFPGIPLAIFFPEVKFLLADSIAKKLKVVSEVVSAIGLTNVTVRHTRVEEIKNEKFDFAVSRAVAPLKDLWYWCRPLLRKKAAAKTPVDPATTNLPPGLICLKGGDLSAEIAESGMRVTTQHIFDIFREPYFEGKQVLFVKY